MNTNIRKPNNVAIEHHSGATLAKTISKSLAYLPKSARGHAVAVIGELVGTVSFLFFAFAGTQVANISSNTNTGTTVITSVVQKNPAELLYISLAFGFSLAVNAWVFFRISGGLFNPAIIGAIIAAYIVQALFPGALAVSTTLGSTVSIAQGVIIEFILTAELVFTIFMLAAEKHTGNFIAPVGIGLALFISELTGVFWTGGSLNPARSLGPAVAIGQFEPYHWIYWVGPLAGTVLAVLLYKVIKALEYESANVDPEAAETVVIAAPTEPPAVSLDNAQAIEKRTDRPNGHSAM